jgi:hypothetical protein
MTMLPDRLLRRLLQISPNVLGVRAPFLSVEATVIHNLPPLGAPGPNEVPYEMAQAVAKVLFAEGYKRVRFEYSPTR